MVKMIPKGTSYKELGMAWYKVLKNGKRAKSYAFHTPIATADAIAIFHKEAKSYEELYSMLSYAPDERSIIKYYENAGVAYEKFHVYSSLVK